MDNNRHILTQPQIGFVKFIGNRNISDTEIVDIKRLISKYYVLKADSLMNDIWQEKGLTEQKMEEILNCTLSR